MATEGDVGDATGGLRARGGAGFFTAGARASGSAASGAVAGGGGVFVVAGLRGKRWWRRG
ncbi:MAG: hypothetical protein ABI886_02685 [Betaproteobacteria bacterium]